MKHYLVIAVVALLVALVVVWAFGNKKLPASIAGPAFGAPAAQAAS